MQIIALLELATECGQSSTATVVLPEPETPMTTTITGSIMVCVEAADHTR